MSEQVFTKFSSQRESIRALLQKDVRFREICADYEEICTWLAALDYSASSEEQSRARELIRDLEEKDFRLSTCRALRKALHLETPKNKFTRRATAFVPRPSNSLATSSRSA